MDVHNEIEHEQVNEVGVGHYRDKLVALCYPELYKKLTKIGALIQEVIETEPEAFPLQSVQLKMRYELDELCRQEEEIIFPLLSQLEQEDKKADSCKPFKTVKYHYTYLISMLQQFKTLLLQLTANSKNVGVLMTLKDNALDFEASLIKVQVNKERTLFSRFRNCDNGCKAL